MVYPAVLLKNIVLFPIRFPATEPPSKVRQRTELLSTQASTYGYLVIRQGEASHSVDEHKILVNDMNKTNATHLQQALGRRSAPVREAAVFNINSLHNQPLPSHNSRILPLNYSTGPDGAHS